MCVIPIRKKGDNSSPAADQEPQIGINLGDPMFRGQYHGKQSHEDDVDDVVQRAKDIGCSKFMVTGSDLEESKHAVHIASKYRESLISSFQLYN